MSPFEYAGGSGRYGKSEGPARRAGGSGVPHLPDRRVPETLFNVLATFVGSLCARAAGTGRLEELTYMERCGGPWSLPGVRIAHVTSHSHVRAMSHTKAEQWYQVYLRRNILAKMSGCIARM